MYASVSPTYSGQFGSEGAELGRPMSNAIDSNGDVWVTDYTNDRVQEFSSTGTLIATYGGYWQFNGPWGIAINQSTDNVYVTDLGNKRVVELSSTGA